MFPFQVSEWAQTPKGGPTVAADSLFLFGARREEAEDVASRTNTFPSHYTYPAAVGLFSSFPIHGQFLS